MALDLLRRRDIQQRLNQGEYVSPEERNQLEQTITEESKAPNTPNRVVDAGVTSATGFALGQSPLANLPGGSAAVSGISSFAGDVVSGRDPEQAGRNALRSAGVAGTKELAKEGTFSLLGRTYGAAGIGNLIGDLAAEGILSKSPNYTRAAARSSIKTPLSLFGLAVGGPLGMLGGSVAGNLLGNELVNDGFIGDMLDVRTNEGYRDKLEDQYGYFQGESQYDRFEERDPGTQLSILEGGYGPGREPSSSALASNTATSDPVGNVFRGIGDAIGDFFGGDDSNGDSNDSDDTDFGDRESEPGGMGGV